MRLFESFEPGQIIGSVTISIGEAEVVQWESLFSSATKDDRFLPHGLVIALMMRGYIAILGERPQGNVHAGQEFEWMMPVPKDLPIIVTLKCLKKELSNGRRWLWLENGVLTQDGAACLKGTMRMLWAA